MLIHGNIIYNGNCFSICMLIHGNDNLCWLLFLNTYADSRNIIYAGDCFSISMLIHGNIYHAGDCFSIRMLTHGNIIYALTVSQ